MFRNVSRVFPKSSTTALAARSGYAFGRLNRAALLANPSVRSKAQLRLHSNSANNTLKVDQPQLMLAFTCNKCETRSSHAFSKQSYTKGTVLIQCPGCKNRHLIADNLKIFRDTNVNLEDILRAKGELVATTTEDLAFEDIPESLRETLGHYAKDAPEKFQKRLNNGSTDLPEPEKKD